VVVSGIFIYIINFHKKFIYLDILFQIKKMIYFIHMPQNYKNTTN
jgi:hypothetical protein